MLNEPIRTDSAVDISFRNAGKKYGDFWALRPTNISISAGERVAILGLSGSGKTTLLHLACGILEASCGEVWANNENINQYDISKRDIGIVFQQPLLFPFHSVIQNVMFPLRVKRRNLAEKKARQIAEGLLRELGLSKEIEEKNITEISGGQAQRVALARAAIHMPPLLFFDEPLSAIDRPQREMLIDWIIKYQMTNNNTLLYVTHDPREAMRIAQRIIVLNDGDILQDDLSFNVYRKPANYYIASLFGTINILPQILFKNEPPNEHCYAVRSENIQLGPNASDSAIKGKALIREAAYLNGIIRLTAYSNEHKLFIDIPIRENKVSIGEETMFSIDHKDVLLLENKQGAK